LGKKWKRENEKREKPGKREKNQGNNYFLINCIGIAGKFYIFLDFEENCCCCKALRMKKLFKKHKRWR
jgi:hypothetical protein